MLNKKNIIIPKDPPTMAIIIGPCRVGTTALANVFAKAGIIAYMQPIKSALRAKETGKTIKPFKIDSATDFILVKETLGAHTPTEFFNPINILLKLGYPKKKLILIPMLRTPNKVLPSWREMWTEFELDNFLKSYLLTSEIKKTAQNNKIKVLPYLHEIIKDNKASEVIKKLFNKLGLENYQVEKNINWENDPRFGEEKAEKSKLNFFDVPPEKFIKEVKNWGKYEYREEPYLHLKKGDSNYLSKNNEIGKIYEEFRKECEEIYGLKINVK